MDTDGWGTGVVRVDSLVPPGSWRRERGEEQSSSRTRQFGHTPCWASVDTANSLPCCSPPSVAVHYTDNSGRCPATHSPCAMLSTRAFHSMLTPLTRSAYRYSHQVAPQIHKKESKELLPTDSHTRTGPASPLTDEELVQHFLCNIIIGIIKFLFIAVLISDQLLQQGTTQGGGGQCC